MVSLLALGVVWFAGFLAHMLVMTAALPGLTVRRAMLMSLTGSAVSNLLPMGRAVGTGLNYSMCRRWGYTRAAFVLFSVMTHLWGLIAKLLLPSLAMLALLLTGSPSAHLLLPTLVALVALAVLAAGLSALLAREDASAALGRAGEHAVAGAGRLVRRPWRVELEGPARELRGQAIVMTRRGWRRPLAGMLGYFGLQALLLWMCLHALGATVGPFQVLAAYAIERLLTVVVLTPGGLGVVEVTMIAMLTGFGVTPLTAAAGVVLYRAFTFALQIPLGGLLLLGWLGLHRGESDPDPLRHPALPPQRHTPANAPAHDPRVEPHAPPALAGAAA